MYALRTEIPAEPGESHFLNLGMVFCFSLMEKPLPLHNERKNDSLTEIHGNDQNYLQFRSVLTANREIFLLNHQFYIKCFLEVERNFDPIGETLRSQRDPAGHSHISLLPFLFLFQRQVTVAFDLVSSDLCYQAWVLVRPGLEAVLMAGKWIDDPAFAAIWSDRQSRRKEYSKAYSGKGLQSTALKWSEELQGVLRRINDEFVHANTDYYGRHLSLQPTDQNINVELAWFEDDHVQEAHTIALLSLVFTAQESLARALEDLLATSVQLRITLSEFHAQIERRVGELMEMQDCRWILEDLAILDTD